MKRTITAIILTLCSIGILFSSCVSSHLVNVWRDPSYNFGPMRSMIVISINNDPIKRRLWEDAFVYELSKYGLNPASSYHLFPNELPDTARLIDTVRQHGYNGVLIISRLPTQTQTTTVEPYVTTTPVSHYDSWHNRYTTRYVEESHPGYIYTSKIVSHEVNVWLTKGSEQVVWSGICMTPDPVSSEQVHDETISLIVKELAKATIISPK